MSQRKVINRKWQVERAFTASITKKLTTFTTMCNTTPHASEKFAKEFGNMMLEELTEFLVDVSNGLFKIDRKEYKPSPKPPPKEVPERIPKPSSRTEEFCDQHATLDCDICFEKKVPERNETNNDTPAFKSPKAKRKERAARVASEYENCARIKAYYLDEFSDADPTPPFSRSIIRRVGNDVKRSCSFKNESLDHDNLVIIEKQYKDEAGQFFAYREHEREVDRILLKTKNTHPDSRQVISTTLEVDNHRLERLNRRRVARNLVPITKTTCEELKETGMLYDERLETARFIRDPFGVQHCHDELGRFNYDIHASERRLEEEERKAAEKDLLYASPPLGFFMT